MEMLRRNGPVVKSVLGLVSVVLCAANSGVIVLKEVAELQTVV